MAVCGGWQRPRCGGLAVGSCLLCEVPDRPGRGGTRWVSLCVCGAGIPSQAYEETALTHQHSAPSYHYTPSPHVLLYYVILCLTTSYHYHTSSHEVCRRPQEHGTHITCLSCLAQPPRPGPIGDVIVSEGCGLCLLLCNLLVTEGQRQVCTILCTACCLLYIVLSDLYAALLRRRRWFWFYFVPVFTLLCWLTLACLSGPGCHAPPHVKKYQVAHDMCSKQQQRLPWTALCRPSGLP